MKCYVIPTIIHYMQQKRTSNPLGSFLRMWYTVTIIYSIILLGVVTTCMNSYKWLTLYTLVMGRSPRSVSYERLSTSVNTTS